MLYSDANLGSSSIDSFNWYPGINISCITCATPFVSPPTDQIYGLVVHTGGCTVGDSVLIRVILPNNFYIPNAFTPNGDGANDLFYIEAQSGVHVVLFQVFNRIGEKVHEGNYPWDGTYKGKPQPPGTYVYIFKLGLFGDEKAVFRKGSVALIR
jgi:gliding motility-associated-like protein